MIIKSFIKKIIYIFILSSVNTFYSQTNLDISDNFDLWATTKPISLSPSGVWSVINESYPNNLSKNTRYLINTKTIDKVEIGGYLPLSFLEDKLFIARKNKTLLFIDLLNLTKKDSLTETKEVLIFDNLNKLAYLNTSNNLSFYHITDLKYPTKPSIDNISNIYKDESNKTNLLAIQNTNTSTSLYQIDLKNGTHKIIELLDKKIEQITFNHTKSKILVKYHDSNFSVIELSKYQRYDSTFPTNSNEDKLNYKISFSLNDEILITYNLKPKYDIIDKYLTIKGNQTVDFGSYNIDNSRYFSLLYNYKTTNLIELNNQKEYFHLGSPNILISKNRMPEIDYYATHQSFKYFIETLTTINSSKFLTTGTKSFIYDLNFNLDHSKVLYSDSNKWMIYDIINSTILDSLPRATANLFNTLVGKESMTPAFWSSDNKKIIFKSQEGLELYNIFSKERKLLQELPATSLLSIPSAIQGQSSTYLDLRFPIIFTNSIRNGLIDNVYKLTNNKVSIIYKNDSDRIEDILVTKSNHKETIVFTKQNHNKPPTSYSIRDKNKKILLINNTPEELYKNRKKTLINFTDKYGVELKALVYYPSNYYPLKKYPMICYLYENLSHRDNNFNISSIQTHDGINTSILNEQGYFVALIDTYVSDEGPGKTALDCVTRAIEQITMKIPSVDKDNLGVTGHSFGGYKVNYIVTQTNLFKAAVSGAGKFDIINEYYSYNYDVKRPNYFRIEGKQALLKDSFSENPQKYFDNSPNISVQNVETPILLWTGLQDVNVPWQHTESFYIALKKHNKPVIALFYKKAAHSLFNNNFEQTDLTTKIVDWFNYHLKHNKPQQWIETYLQI